MKNTIFAALLSYFLFLPGLTSQMSGKVFNDSSRSQPNKPLREYVSLGNLSMYNPAFCIQQRFFFSCIHSLSAEACLCPAKKEGHETPDSLVGKTRSTAFIYENEKSWESVGEGVMRQVMGYDGQLMLVKVKFEKGAIGILHSHYHTQTTYVVSGRFEFTVGDEKKIIKAGDGVYIAPNVLHGCICLESGVLIDCFAPMRDEFLK